MAGQVQRHRGQGQVCGEPTSSVLFNSRLRDSHLIQWGAGEKLGRENNFTFTTQWTGWPY